MALLKEMTARRGVAHAEVDPAPALANLREAIGNREGPVSFYWPIRTELDPRPVMEDLARTRDVCLPVTVGYAPLIFRPWEPGADMEIDPFGVAVPAGSTEVTPRVLVVPLLAFNTAGHRLGYGAGHYDRTLAKLRPAGSVTAIGLAFEAQLVDTLPTEDTDQPLDLIVTERTIRHILR